MSISKATNTVRIDIEAFGLLVGVAKLRQFTKASLTTLIDEDCADLCAIYSYTGKKTGPFAVFFFPSFSIERFHVYVLHSLDDVTGRSTPHIM